VLLAMVASEISNQRDAGLFHRRFGTGIARQALTVTMLAAALIFTGTMILVGITPHGLRDVLFEVISAFSTVGLSTGITAELPPAGQMVIIALMYIGRVGTITVATALAMGDGRRPYRYPEENPIVG
jgi:trk system potassium uptake protein